MDVQVPPEAGRKMLLHFRQPPSLRSPHPWRSDAGSGQRTGGQCDPTFYSV